MTFWKFWVATLLLFNIKASSGLCVPNNKAGEVYEYAPGGTQVLSLDGVGMVGTEVDLALDSTLSSFLELSDVNVVVKPDVNITRNDGNSAAVLTGVVTCTIISLSSPRPVSINVQIKNINANDPEFSSASYSSTISEADLPGKEILTVSATDPDGLRPTYSISCDECSTTLFRIDSSTGLITLTETLSYPPSNYDLTVTATTNDNSPYGERERFTSTIVVVNVEDVDNHPPQFQPCSSQDGCFLSYSSDISTTYTGDLSIMPQNIAAEDLDPGINATITYAFTNTSSPQDYADHFFIERETGLVTVSKAVTSRTVYTLGISATESTGKSTFALLRVDVSEKDDYKPELNIPLSEGYIQENSLGSLAYVTEDENGTIPLKISASDLDNINASFVYKVTPEEFQITSDGFVIYSPGVSGVYSSGPASFEVTAINIDADTDSPNRASDTKTILLTVVPSPLTTTAVSTTYTTVDTTIAPSTAATSGSTTAAFDTSSSNDFSATTSSLPVSDSTTNTADGSSTTNAPETGISTTNPGFVVTEVPMVEAATLYAVAGTLGGLLFVCFIVIAYLVYKICKPSKDSDDKSILDETSSTSPSVTHTNFAYEYGETNDDHDNEPAPAEDPTYENDPAQATEVEVEDEALNVQEDDSGTEINDYEELEENDGETPAPIEEYEEAPPAPPIVVNNAEEAATSFIDEIPNGIPGIAVAAAAASAAVVAAAEFSSKAIDGDEEDDIHDYGYAFKQGQVKADKILKNGEFGETRLVTIEKYGLDRTDTQAVVKSLEIGSASTSDVNSCHAKIRLMKKACEQEHSNILQFYGTHEDAGQIHVATMYAPHGDLNSYLKSVKAAEDVEPHQLMLIIAGIGKGLQFLHAKDIVHCHLRSKCIMLDSEFNAMISDYENNEVTSVKPDDDRKRWQALEVLGGELSVAASDIWSFGVVMWEITSYGTTPYVDLSENELYNYLADSNRLKQPSGCSDSLFYLMESCWNKDTRFRPDMYVLNGNLSEKLLEDSNELIGLDLSSGPANRGIDPNDVSITIPDDPTSPYDVIVKSSQLQQRSEDITAL
ncbi:uncharacterized protein LOC143459998 isoform X9 [Clavelina lepadiformis]|uniref:uncharacterized protein LOC143459998 isoform X9 n=1 Tax=Clavelina lepadiformis TaxID=159417 RepID=UPI004042E50B